MSTVVCLGKRSWAGGKEEQGLNTVHVMQVVKGPVTKHLPAGCRRVAFSRTAPDLVKLR